MKDRLKDISGTLVLKDFSKEKLLLRCPHLEDLLNELIPLIPEKKYLTIDYSEIALKKGQNTCRDVRWHTDGINNHYLIIAWGDFRTLFLNERYESLKNTVERIKEIHEKFKDEKGNEIEEGVPFVYDSTVVHRGQKADRDGKRIFLRLCFSDYIRPKNAVLANKS